PLRGEGAGILAQLHGSVRAAFRLLLRCRSAARRRASRPPVRPAADARKSGALAGAVGPCGRGIGREFDSLASAASRRRGVGAVVVWPNDDTRAQVPAEIATRFPGLVADVPRAFERAVQGRLPLLRIGWGVIRPQADAAKGPPDAAQNK